MDPFDKWVGKNSDVLYAAAVLTRKSQVALYEAVNKRIPVPPGWKNYCHHMTVKFRPTEQDRLPPLNEPVELFVLGVAVNDKGIAVAVKPSIDLNMSADQSPHVTVATAPGVSPVYSNELLKTEKMLFLHLTLDAFTGIKTAAGIVPHRPDAALENF